MTPTELAAKIAEEVCRTIEREKGIVKAQIAEAVEKVLCIEATDKPFDAAVKAGLQRAEAIREGTYISGVYVSGAGTAPAPDTPKTLATAESMAKFAAAKYRLGEWKTINAPGQIVRIIKYVGPDYRDDDGHVKAFKRFTQYVGPAMSYHDAPDGVRYRYQPFGWRSSDPAKIVARINALAAQIQACGAHTIVWRDKPMFEQLPDGAWGFYCRLHVLPYSKLDGEKPECEELSEAG